MSDSELCKKKKNTSKPVSKFTSHSKKKKIQATLQQSKSIKSRVKKNNTFPYLVQNIMCITSVNIQQSERKIQWLSAQWDVTFSESDLQLNNRGASAALPSSLHLCALQESAAIHSGYSFWRLQVILPCLFSHWLTAFSARELYAFTS